MAHRISGETVQASILHGRGAAEVSCRIGVLEPDAEESEWIGDYEGAGLATEPREGAATLKLADGRTFPIIVTRAHLGTGRGHFRGSGPPPD